MSYCRWSSSEHEDGMTEQEFLAESARIRIHHQNLANAIIREHGDSEQSRKRALAVCQRGVAKIVKLKKEKEHGKNL